MPSSTISVSDTIAPTRVSPAYRVGLAVVVLAMLALPMLYLGLIGLTAFVVWWHLTANSWLLGGSAAQIRLLLYATPVLAGLVLMFFMVKPILARPVRQHEHLTIDPENEPALFALIDEICRQVRAPRPQRVYVDCAANASAGFAPRRLSLFRNELVLTIGLPLAAALSIREFAGVLAHEFGHFAQGGGMRLTAIVRGVNAWFARVVYERDQWDEMLERRSKEGDGRLMAVFAVARGAVWLSRKALNGLMLGGHAISCFMMRHMEYDADSYEIKIGGTDAFIRTSMRLRELGMAAHFAYGDLRHSLDQGALPDNLPVYTVERSRRLPAELLAHLRSASDAKTGLFDTHPSDADRIRAAEAAGLPGVLLDADAPATQLFRNFDAVCVAATRHHFEHDLGLSLAALSLVDTGMALRDSEKREETLNASARFFGECWSPFRPFRLRTGELDSPAASVPSARLITAREAMRVAGAEVARQYGEFDALEAKRQNAVAARELLAAGFLTVKAEDFDLPAGTESAAVEAERAALEGQRALEPALDVFERLAAERLSNALAESADVSGDTALSRRDIRALVAAANAFSRVMPDLRELRRLHFAEMLIEHNAGASPKPEQTAAYLLQLQRRVAVLRDRIGTCLAAADCRSGFAVSPMTLAGRCGLPAAAEQASTSEVIDRAFRLQSDIVGQLVATALEREDSLDGTLTVR